MKNWTDEQVAVAVKAVARYSLTRPEEEWEEGEGELGTTLKVLEFLVAEQVRRATIAE